jgi:leukotriene-A4 hydrolase
LTSEDFKTYFLDYFKDKDLDSIDWNAWFYSPGMPPIQNKFNDILSKKSVDLASRWISNFENETFQKDDLKNWTTIEIC